VGFEAFAGKGEGGRVSKKLETCQIKRDATRPLQTEYPVEKNEKNDKRTPKLNENIVERS